MARSKNKKKRSRSSDQLQRSKPKHSNKDLIKAAGISGLVIALIGALFFVQVESKPLIDYLTDKVSGASANSKNSEPEDQMDRYTKEESEGLDKIIEEKSKGQ